MNNVSPLAEAELRGINPRIRLAPRDQIAMRAAFARTLPRDAEVYLYGSRASLDSSGGDIDLLIHVPGLDFVRELELASALSAELERAVGERRIDLHFTAKLGPAAKPFVQLVLPRAVRLYP